MLSYLTCKIESRLQYIEKILFRTHLRHFHSGRHTFHTNLTFGNFIFHLIFFSIHSCFYRFLYFILSIFTAYIPAPIVFGSIVDSTCLVWRDLGCGKQGSCWLYDNEEFWFRLHGLQVSLSLSKNTNYIGIN